MQSRFAAQQAWVNAFVGQGLNRVSKVGLSTFQWTICTLLALVALIVAFCLFSIRSNTVELNANIKENTRAALDLRANLVKSLDSVDRRVAESNQKLSDLAVELDDLITAQKAAGGAGEGAGDDPQKPREAGRTGQKQSDLTVHRRKAKHLH